MEEVKNFFKEQWRPIFIVLAILSTIAGIFGNLDQIAGFFQKPYAVPAIIGLAYFLALVTASWVVLGKKPSTVDPRVKVHVFDRRYRQAAAIVLAILIAVGVAFIVFWIYRECAPTDRVIVLVAEFSPEASPGVPKDRAITQGILDQLDQLREDEPRMKVKSLGEVVLDKETARKWGGEEKATIVIWGWYAKTATHIDLRSHFEIMPSREREAAQVQVTPDRRPINDFNSFEVHTRLSQKMTSLTAFTVGLIYYLDQDYEEAIRHFKTAADNAPEGFNLEVVHFYKGNAHSLRAEPDEAISEYERAVEINPDFAEAHNNLGVAYAGQGRLDDAIGEFEEAIEKAALDDLNRANVYYNLGLCYVKKGETDEAIKALQEAVNLRDNYAPAHYWLGCAYYAQDELDEAVEEYQQAIELEPDHADAHFNLGVIYHDQSDLDRALKELRETIELRPDHIPAHFALGLAHVEKEEHEKACAELNEVLALSAGEEWREFKKKAGELIEALECGQNSRSPSQ
jgi:tetratricopeptide (TPR) repeat protein